MSFPRCLLTREFPNAFREYLLATECETQDILYIVFGELYNKYYIIETQEKRRKIVDKIPREEIFQLYTEKGYTNLNIVNNERDENPRHEGTISRARQKEIFKYWILINDKQADEGSYA